MNGRWVLGKLKKELVRRIRTGNVYSSAVGEDIELLCCIAEREADMDVLDYERWAKVTAAEAMPFTPTEEDMESAEEEEETDSAEEETEEDD